MMNDKDVQLLLAARNGRADEVRTLLRDGADIEAKDGGWSALHKAAWNGRADVVRMLLEDGADIQATSASGWTALHDAAWRGGADVVRVLLEAGADMDAKNNHDETARDVAVIYDMQDVIGLLDAWTQRQALRRIVADFEEMDTQFVQESSL